MLTGVIDLGSNTIRLSIYKCTKAKFSLLLNEKSFARPRRVRAKREAQRRRHGFGL
jgi:exopolyphosphatase/pppGpp-phosphohydrolase